MFTTTVTVQLAVTGGTVRFKGFDPAYALFEFGKDGSVTREMLKY